MRRRTVCMLTVVVVASVAAIVVWTGRKPLRTQDILAAYRQHPPAGGIKVIYPQDGTLFPPEIVPPVFRWEDPNARASAWLVQVDLGMISRR